jgi:hypothetical protein
MKRCEVCKKLTDNGDKYCPKCGSPFKYDPKVSPFSETKIGLAILCLSAIGFFVARSLPPQMPDPSACSRASYSRFKNIVVLYHNDIMTILAENYISSKNLSEIVMKRKAAEAMPVPACLEPARKDFVNYLNALYYTAIPAAWDEYDSAAVYAESAAGYLDQLQADLEKVRACLPDCQ